MKLEDFRHRWARLKQDHPMPLIDRRRVIGERMMISNVTLHEGCRVAPHSHDNEQFIVLLEGRIRFLVGPTEDSLEEVVLEGGEVYHLKPGVWHGAEALADSHVLDLFSPPSEKTGVDAR
ncbi:MAG: cupin domain-containing protein [Planctomycetota bacterium]